MREKIALSNKVKKITVDQSKVLKKSTVLGFFGHPV